MTLWAVCALCVLSGKATSTQKVDTLHNGFKMGGIHAAAVRTGVASRARPILRVTNVIQLKSFGNRATEQLIDGTMRACLTKPATTR
jgi:hypothetical protein